MNPRLNIVASIEARMGSSRLPGKVLKKFSNIEALALLVKRLKKCRYLSDIIVATTINAEDDLIVSWCKQNNINYFRGSEKDVLDRVVKAHEYMNTDLIVEITGDCPFTDPDIVDMGIESFLINNVDVVTNCGNHLTWPLGQYFQVFPLNLLKEVNLQVEDPFVHEHVSLYFYENKDKYNLFEIIAPTMWRFPNLRMVLDYEEDFCFLNELYKILSPTHGDYFNVSDIIKVIKSKPELVKINESCKEKEPRG